MLTELNTNDNFNNKKKEIKRKNGELKNKVKKTADNQEDTQTEENLKKDILTFEDDIQKRIRNTRIPEGVNFPETLVLDQGDCGSCWAVSAASMLSIALGNKVNVSPSLMMYCKDEPQICANSDTFSGSSSGSFLDVIAVLGTYGYKTIEEVPYSIEPMQCPGEGQGIGEFGVDIFYEVKKDRKMNENGIEIAGYLTNTLVS